MLGKLTDYFDAVTWLESWILNLARLDLFQFECSGSESPILDLARNLDFVPLVHNTTGGKDRLQQSNTWLKDLLPGIGDAASYVIELLGPGRDANHVAVPDEEVERGRVA